MSYAATLRQVIDRVHVSLRHAVRPRIRELYGQRGLKPGLEIDLFYSLLDHPVPEAAVAARMVYWPFDPAAEEAAGLVERVDGHWQLTGPGREIAVKSARIFAEDAERLWSHRPSPSMPGLDAVAAVLPLLGRLLEAGQATGGPAFHALTPVWEPSGASPSALLVSRVEALRHHRADAHRAAWAAAGLTVEQIQALGPGPERDAIEAETNRRDAPVYEALTAEERLVLLGGLGALPDGLTDR
jgi:hypothetical protein